MKKFFFRLETLLKLRQVREGRMQRELAYANQKWAQLKEKAGSIEKQITDLMEEIRKRRNQNLYGLQETYSQLLEHLKFSLSQVKESLYMQTKLVEQKQAQLKQIIQERKVIEKIKEKHYAQWRVHAEQTEGALLDEISVKHPHSE